MKLLSILFSLTILFAQAEQYSDLRKGTENSHFLFTNATIHSSSSKTITNASLIIKDGLIVALGKKLKAPKTATVIDLKGKHLYAGFIDLYTEYGLSKKAFKAKLWQDGPTYNNKRSGANAWNGAIHSEVNWVSEFKPSAKAAKSFIDQGFTTVQSSIKDGIFRGKAFVANLNAGLANNNVLKASSMPELSFTRGNTNQWYPHSLMGSIALLRQTFIDAAWYDKAQKAYKLNTNQEKPEFNRALEALRGYKSEFFLFESNGLQNQFRADKVLDEFKVKGMLLGSGQEYQRINDVKAMKRSLLMTVNFPKAPNVTDLMASENTSIESLRHWEMAPYNLGKLEKAKINFALSLHSLKSKADFWKNLRLAVKNGLSERRALAALTESPAQLLGLSKQLGSIAKGKIANFVISDKSIFDEKAMIIDVWVAGKKHIVNAETGTDYRGHYTANLFDLNFNLSLTGTKSKTAASFKLDKKTYKVKKLNQSDELLKFSVLLDTISDQSVNIELRKAGSDLKGYASLQGGDIKALSFALDSVFSEKKKDKKKDKSSSTLVSSLTYPNKAFGFKELPKTETVLFKNATVWTSEKAGILQNSDVLVKNGKISKIGKGLSAPRAARIVDAKGKHLTAGVIDEHSHIAINGGVNELSQSNTAEVRIADVVSANDINVYRQMAGGVTMSQLLHGSGNPIGGQAQVIKLRWGSNAEQMKFKPAPLSIKFALGENVKHSNFGDRYTLRYPQTRMGVKTLMEDGFNASIDYDKEWKLFNNLSSSAKKRFVPPRRDLELEALSQIRNSEMFVHCHSYVQSEILMLMRLAESYSFKIQTFTHILEGYKVADEMAKHGAGASTFSDWWSYKFEVYDAMNYNAKLMADRGVVTSMNSDDAEMARRLNQEAGKAVLYGGMSQEEAWKLVTINPAKQLKVDKYVGSIKVGKQADLVLWNNNPLSIYAAVQQTWIDGKLYFDTERDKALRAELAEEKQNLIQKILNTGVKMKKRGEVKKPKLYHCVDEKNWYENAYNGEAY